MDNSKKKDPIAQALDLVPIELDHTSVIIPAGEEDITPDLDADVETARVNIKLAVEAGQQALGELQSIAKQSQHPRAYEVLATLINTITASSEKLVDIQKKKVDITKTKIQSQPSGPNTVNNNLFVGNATDLLKMLDQAKKAVPPKE